MQISPASNNTTTHANGWVANESNFEMTNIRRDYSDLA